MNDIIHAIVGALLVIYAPLPLIALMRCIVNWNRAVYVRDLFREATYSNDPDNKLNDDEDPGTGSIRSGRNNACPDKREHTKDSRNSLNLLGKTLK